MTTTILIIGRLPDGNLGAVWANYAEPGSGIEPNPTLYPDGGGGASPPSHQYPHDATCHHSDGAAAQIAETIMATDDVGPTQFDWTTAEYGSFVVEKSSGVFGALDNNIYSDGQLNYAVLDYPDGSLPVRGIVHNHPSALNGGAMTSRNAGRYPSPEDWDALDRLFERFGASQPNYAPVIWVLDSFGVTRAFSRSEKDYFKSLSPAAKQDGQGLEGREVLNDC